MDITEHPLYKFLTAERKARIEEVLDKRTSDITIILENVHNAHNISAVIRSAEAFGIAEVFIIGNADNLSEGISLGSEQWIKVHRCKDSQEALSLVRARGYTVVVTSPAIEERESLPIAKLPFVGKKIAFVFGNERIGASPLMIEAADQLTHIQMYGFVESFNISVACALTLFAARLQSENGAMFSPISPELREELRSQWITASVRNGEAVANEILQREQGEK